MADFKIPDLDLVVETKGRFKLEDRKKMLAVLACNPDLDLLMVFSDPNKTISKASKTTYGSWCTDHGIPWMGLKDFETKIRKDKDANFLRLGKQNVGLKGLFKRGT